MQKTLFVTLLAAPLLACGVDDRDLDTGYGPGGGDGAGEDDGGGPDADDGGGDDGDDGGGDAGDDGGSDDGEDTGNPDGTEGDPDGTEGDDGGEDDGPKPDPGDGPCGCGFPASACQTDFEDPVGTEGPMPPLCGGGSGLGDDPPTNCFGGNFGSYSDVSSFCSYFVNRFRYLENECGNFNTVNLQIDASLAAIAQAEAEAVADGAYPSGQVTCGGTPCGPLDGPRYNMNSGAAWLYIDGWNANGAISKDSMYTAAESPMIIQANPLWADQQGNPIYERACQFTSEFANAIVYHYCNWDGAGVYGDPTTQPTRVGCGTAVDTEGITWRVVKLGE